MDSPISVFWQVPHFCFLFFFTSVSVVIFHGRPVCEFTTEEITLFRVSLRVLYVLLNELADLEFRNSNTLKKIRTQSAYHNDTFGCLPSLVWIDHMHHVHSTCFRAMVLFSVRVYAFTWIIIPSVIYGRLWRKLWKFLQIHREIPSINPSSNHRKIFLLIK